MKLCRFNEARLGVVEGGYVHDVTAVLDRLPAYRTPLPRHDPVIAELATLLPLIQAAWPSAQRHALGDVRLLPPVANPGKIVAAPVNYRRHLDEVLDSADLHHGNQINEIRRAGLFLKATSSLIGVDDTIHLRHLDRRNDHEVELAVIIGRRADRVSARDALAHVAGYAIGLDITLRGPESRSFRKSIDTYTVLGPWLVTPDEFGNPGSKALSLSVDGEPRQDASTSDLVLSVPELIEFATAFYTLEPGDILLTGTPEGVGPIVPGCTIEAAVEAVGTIRVAVA